MAKELPLKGGETAPSPLLIDVSMTPYQVMTLIEYLAQEEGGTMGKGMPIRQLFDDLVEMTGSPAKAVQK